MSGTLRLRGATSGYSELQAPAVAADQTFILPTAGGTLLTTDSPVPKLTLELGSASQPSLTFEGDTDTGLYSSGTNTLNLVTGGNSRLSISPTGQVIIGGVLTCQSGISGLNYIASGAGSAANPEYRFASLGVGLFSASGTGNVAISTNAIERLTVDSLGNVGIGTSSPFGATGYGCLTLSGSSGGALAFAAGATNSFEVYADSTNGYRIYDRTNTTERLRIDSSGNVGIGTASPDFKLDVNGSIGISEGQAVQWHNTAGSVSAQIYGDASDNLVFRNTSSASERMRIDSSGRLLVGTSTARTNFSLTGAGVHDGLVQLETTAEPLGLSLCRNNAGSPVFLSLSGTGGSTIGSTDPVSEDDGLGTIVFSGMNGLGAFSTAAFISAEVDAAITAATSEMPGRLLFSTTADGASSPTERMQIDSSGRLLVGTSSNTDDYRFQLDSSSYKGALFTRYGSDGVEVALGSARGTQGSKTALSNNDYGGLVTFKGYDGSNYQSLAWIGGVCEGQSPASGDSPGRLVFCTTANGASSPTEQLRINSIGRMTGHAVDIDRMFGLLYARLLNHGNCNTNGPGANFTEFDVGDNSFSVVGKSNTTAPTGYQFIGDGYGNAFTVYVGCGDNVIFGTQGINSTPNYHSWVLIHTSFAAAANGLPLNTTRTSLP